MVNSRLPVFTERFNKLRGNKTQGQFAEMLGLSRPTVSLYESGKRIPGAEELRTIAKKCGVSADYLLGLQDDPTTDKDLKFISEYTGLSSDTLQKLHQYAHLRGHKSGILETFDTFLYRFSGRFAQRLSNIKKAALDAERCLYEDPQKAGEWMYSYLFDDLRKKLYFFSELCQTIPNDLFNTKEIYKALEEKSGPLVMDDEKEIDNYLISGDYN